MSLLFMDSFDHYATADITEKWTTIPTVLGGTPQAPAIGAYGRNSTNGLRTSAASNAHTGQPVVITVSPSTPTTCFIGVACKSLAIHDGSGRYPAAR